MASALQPATAVTATLYDEATGQAVWNNFSTFNDHPSRQITLPAGRYRLSVLNPNIVAHASVSLTSIATLEYRFAFIP